MKKSLNLVLAALALTFNYANAQTTNYVSKFTSSGAGASVNNSIIYDNGASIGIGTTTPTSTFQIRDNSSKASIGSASDISTDVLHYGTSYFGMNAARYYTGSSTSQNWSINGDTYNNGGGVIYGSILGDMYFVTIPSTGGSLKTLSDADIAARVAFKISADGKLYGKELNVQASIFPDYVFKKAYRLKPLSEVKAYIFTNHRLPEMPSEQEVAKNGLNLGEINTLLVKKVEELTLYMIDKDKQVEEQKQLIQSMQLQLNLLKQQLTKLAIKTAAKKH